MSSIKALIVLAVASFYLAIVPGGKRPEQLVPYPMFREPALKKSGFIRAAMGAETLGKFLPVVRLDTFNGAWKGLNEMFQKQGGGIGTVLFKSLHKTPSGILVNGSVLIEMIFFGVIYKADRRDKFHVNLDALSGMVHLLIRFGDILGVGRMERHDALFFEETVQPGNGTGIAALHELNPENNKTGMWISSAHISDKLYLGRGMLVRMVVWPAGESAQGLNGAVITPFPAVDVLPVGLVFNGSVSDTIFFSIFDKG